ncbi:MAG: hypothetical protein Q4C59_05855 [Lachnospiraceae bacterium]|nr:hypothetical protein [Lachnospiraceae bacterium]
MQIREERIEKGRGTPEQREYLRQRCISKMMLSGMIMTALKIFLEKLGMGTIGWIDVLLIAVGAACFLGFFEGILVLYRQEAKQVSGYQWHEIEKRKGCQIIPFQYRRKALEGER